MKKVAVVSTVIALYRYEVANKLSQQKEILYKFYTSIKTHSGIKTVDKEKAKVTPENGGLNWSFVKNVYIKFICIWQFGVLKVGLSKEYTTLILLGNMYCLSTWVNAILGRLTGKHIIMWTHGLKGGDLKLQLFFRLMFYRFADDLFVYEKRAKKLLLKEGFKEDNIHVIYNSLDYSVHKKIRSELTANKLDKERSKLFNNEYPTLVYCGRLVSSKKVNLLIEAVRLLQKDDIEVNCLIIGDGDMGDDLRMKVKEYNLKNVHFYGACYDEVELSKLIGMSDLLVSPGNIGLAVVHAFSFGTPVLSHSNLVKQMPEVEIIDVGENGDLFLENDVQDMKDKIEQWFNKKIERDVLREKCYVKVDKYYNPEYQVGVFNRIVNRGKLKG